METNDNLLFFKSSLLQYDKISFIQTDDNLGSLSCFRNYNRKERLWNSNIIHLYIIKFLYLYAQACLMYAECTYTIKSVIA